MSMQIVQKIAQELNVQAHQVQAAITLLDEGATVPFIARYRKEVTAGLDDTQLRTLEERLRYLRELEERRQTILKSIEEQDKLTPALQKDILEADTKTRLEDLYLPYKPKRRTKAQIAREAGLAPLAETLFNTPETDPETAAADYIDADKGVADSKAALEGAKQILMEQFAEDAALLGEIRDYLWSEAVMVSNVASGKETEGQKFADYFDYHEALHKIPSHRALALFRGRNETVLQLNLQESAEAPEDPRAPGICEGKIGKHFGLRNQGRAADKWLQDVVRWTWRVKIRSHLEVELLMRLREAAEAEAIQVFSSNLKDLLLAAPAGAKATLGLDPGLRTGVKVAITDATGKLVEHGAIFPHAPRNQWQESIAVLAVLAKKHHVSLVSIGNGTASRETDKLVAELIKQHPELKLQKLMVSEAGASVYSASELAAKEFPDLDVTIRGAVSIARRLQDPLAELVKIDPKAIGVGQYQHDVSQMQLARSLDAVVEDCVNAVGVDVNMASAALLARVSGLNQTHANNIIHYRDSNGAFKNRKALLKVPRLGAKTFEQAAGFLRIMGGDNPLDASAVHPEAYPVIEQIVAKNQRPMHTLIGDSSFLRKLKASDYTSEAFGVPTVTDIIQELDKPGRDPRPEFKTAEFMEGVETISDLKENMVLEGVVTNVTNFGAFVDVGVHQDGLVHISALADTFVKDPRDVVKAGDVVKVKVLEVDVARKRIAMTMRLQDDSRDYTAPSQRERGGAASKNNKSRQKTANGSNSQQKYANTGSFGNSLADAFARAKK
ncbi:Tex family protein [Candidatus Venteria ishoeyi]|uniref:Tex family protein n=1 Tax=Candidatus Venteria ishoeyi TaxID=1899563 RepID=UPI002A4E25A3|nr:Tex family protein [Candidatus Venteria ishoeyi]